ncbi:P-loop containing nucleoside triphosphate hydrolase protein [Rhexocercosporidium sp. MPI-PUGE-AT-0058]|nr:P-loop containing nucleoside triphosphate hydrolase protein [Rhexocercosporidium sp. MPI-PUGE-AT-0058]
MENLSAEETHPYFFKPDQNINRRQYKRVVPMQVLSLGMSRTGTASMKAALHILGYGDVYHGTDVYSNIQDCDMWIPALQAKYFGKGKPFGRAEFDKLLGHCAAITDGPANCFGPELIDAYPDAKVVLVKRDYDAWLKSFDGIIEGAYSWKFKLLGYTDPGWMGKVQRVIDVWLPGQFKASTAEECRANARAVYEKHYAEARRITPQGRLLEYRLGDGWEPLCKFLGKKVPDVPFPKINESSMLKRQLEIVAMKTLKRSLRNIGLVASTLAISGVFIYWLTTSFSNQQ